VPESQLGWLNLPRA